MSKRYRIKFKSGSDALQTYETSANSVAEARAKFKSSHSSKAQIEEVYEV
ncbi:MAG: hypothetical protein ACTTJ6_03380 [Treponema sp.]